MARWSAPTLHGGSMSVTLGPTCFPLWVKVKDRGQRVLSASGNGPSPRRGRSPVRPPWLNSPLTDSSKANEHHRCQKMISSDCSVCGCGSLCFSLHFSQSFLFFFFIKHRGRIIRSRCCPLTFRTFRLILTNALSDSLCGCLCAFFFFFRRRQH